MSDPSYPLPDMTDAMRTWVHAHAPGAVRTMETVASTPRSLVVRMTTTSGVLFFKSDKILPPPEGVVARRLSERWPEHIAPLVAVHAEHGWSLTRDAGRAGLDDASTAMWCRVVDRFARVQIDTGLTADEWVAIGCRDFRGPAFQVEVDAMLEGAAPDLAAGVRTRLRARHEQIAVACADLAADGIPATLVHQDFVPVNIIASGDAPVFIDWSDTVVGHPFFGFDRLLDSCWTDSERKTAVIDAYLAAFGGVAPAERLRASFQRVLSLRVIYECVRWHHELAATDPSLERSQFLRRDMLGGLTMIAR